MSLWSRIVAAVEALTRGEKLTDVLERLKTPPEQTAAFAIAVIGLGAKMAKADGIVTRDEVTAFRQVFHIPPEEEQNAARVFNLARTDVAGYDAYARSIARMFASRPRVLEDLLEGLFFIAMADGDYHPDEDGFLENVARIFGLSDSTFNAIRSRSVPTAAPDPYAILGCTPDDDIDHIRRTYRRLARDYHPDQMMARGIPEEAVRLAERQLATINAAWDVIALERGTR